MSTFRMQVQSHRGGRKHSLYYTYLLYLHTYLLLISAAKAQAEAIASLSRTYSTCYLLATYLLLATFHTCAAECGQKRTRRTANVCAASSCTWWAVSIAIVTVTIVSIAMVCAASSCTWGAVSIKFKVQPGCVAACAIPFAVHELAAHTVAILTWQYLLWLYLPAAAQRAGPRGGRSCRRRPWRSNARHTCSSPR